MALTRNAQQKLTFTSKKLTIRGLSSHMEKRVSSSLRLLRHLSSSIAHDITYGLFWDGVDLSETKNIGLKDGNVGYDCDIEGYGWGSLTEYGYVGGGSSFLLGMQMAMGSVAGLLKPGVEDAVRTAMEGADNGTWQPSEILPNMTISEGNAMNTGIETMINSTRQRIEKAKNSQDDTKRKERRAIIELEERNDSDDDCDDDDDNKSSKKTHHNSSKHSDKKKNGFSNPPSTAAVYRPPWKTAYPVYFRGQCDNCHKQTGYNSNGHGSFQSCSLIYRGQEYWGQTGENDHKYTCEVEFSC